MGKACKAKMSRAAMGLSDPWVSPVYYAGSGFRVAAVEAPFSSVREKLQDWRAIEWYCDIHLGPVRPAIPDRFLSDYSHFLGLAESAWTIVGLFGCADPAARLSREFRTRALALSYEDTGDTLSYRLCDHGEVREEYFHCLQQETSGFTSAWRPGLRPDSDEHRFVDATCRELGLRLPYPWLERLADGRLCGHAGFDLDFSNSAPLPHPAPVLPSPPVPGELLPTEIVGFDLAVVGALS